MGFLTTGVRRTSSISLSLSLRVSVVWDVERRDFLAGERERLRRERAGERERERDRERPKPCLNPVILCKQSTQLFMQTFMAFKVFLTKYEK